MLKATSFHVKNRIGTLLDQQTLQLALASYGGKGRPNLQRPSLFADPSDNENESIGSSESNDNETVAASNHETETKKKNPLNQKQRMC